MVFGDEGEAACPPASWRGLEATGTVTLLEERPVTGTVTPLGGRKCGLWPEGIGNTLFWGYRGLPCGFMRSGSVPGRSES